MNVTVIGHICKDVVHAAHSNAGSTLYQTFGGILYSIVTLARILGEGDSVQPVFGVGHADYDALLELLKRYPNVDTRGIFTFDGPTNEVHLFYQGNGQTRIECSAHIAQPIPFSRIKPLLDTDGLLVNMISGYDITLDTLDAIRISTRERRVPLHLDFHSLTLGVDHDARRFRRPLTDWRRWCFMAHSVQMSEEEAAGLTPERYDESMLIHQLMSLMVGTLILTRGKRGTTVVVQDIHKKLTRYDLAGGDDVHPSDPTGCGDVFGAAFLAFALRFKDSREASVRASQAAAFNAGIVNPHSAERLGEEFRSFQTAQQISHSDP